MELIEEIEPILWAYVADVPQEHIMENKYEEGEEERVDKAIEIINSGHIYLEYVPDYNIAKLEEIIEEHIVKHNVRHVFFDYIHITTELISEFQASAKAHMTVREDQVLANVSTRLKDLCNKYDISIDTWTQVSGDWKNENNRDQTIVRGSKAIIDKADIASITSRITASEKKKLEKILRSEVCFGKPDPDLCMTFYKNRGGKYNDIKVWMHVDYSTMRVHDLFCTDKDCNLYKDIQPTYTQIEEDKIVVVNSKDGIIMTDDEIIKEFVPSHSDKVLKIEDVGDYFSDDEKKVEKMQKDINKMKAEFEKDKRQVENGNNEDKVKRFEKFSQIENIDEQINCINNEMNEFVSSDSEEGKTLIAEDDDIDF